MNSIITNAVKNGTITYFYPNEFVVKYDKIKINVIKDGGVYIYYLHYNDRFVNGFKYDLSPLEV